MNMQQKRVLCVMLAAGRQAMVERAVRCFNSQTYENKLLVILDNGPEPLDILSTMAGRVIRMEPELGVTRPIGKLRNLANALSSEYALDAEIIAHWDSDDWSHPARLIEQVALLESTQAQAVGYREMLFWDSTKAQIDVDPSKPGPEGVGCLGIVRSVGEAWLYSQANPRLVLGTSLCYFRKTWEKTPFPEIHTGEDTQWLHKVKAGGVPSFELMMIGESTMPRMIASIHGGNTCAEIKPESREWKRVPQWDEHCQEVMCLQ